MTVPVHVAPQRADSIEVFPSCRIDQKVSVGRLDHERFPLGHLREGVPQHLLVEILQTFHVERRTASSRAVIAVDRSCSLRPAHNEIRRRAVPSGTVGGRMPWTKTRASNKRALIAI